MITKGHKLTFNALIPGLMVNVTVAHVLQVRDSVFILYECIYVRYITVYMILVLTLLVVIRSM